MAKLKCKDCGYENEPERIYCHECGVKLDRSLVPRQENRTEPKQVQRRVKKLISPKRGFFVGFWRSLIATLACAALAAALVQIFRPVPEVPKMPESTFVDSLPISMILEQLVRNGGGKSLRLDDKSVNDYLFGAVRAKNEGFLSDYAKYDRTFVKTRNDVIEITVQYSIYDYPLYATTFYKLGIDENNGGLLAENCGGRFGSLPVHPMVMAYLEYPFKQLWNATDRDKRVMEKLAGVKIAKGGVVVTAPQQPGE
jgi:hypothetical protein